MSEDKDDAKRFAAKDLERLMQTTISRGAKWVEYGTALPAVKDGEPVFVHFTLGGRHDLSIGAARRAAAEWQRITKHVPNGVFYLSLPGYDDDPRNLWEFTEVRRYIRRWAKYAGIRHPDDITVEVVDQHGQPNIALLTICGVFGEDLRQEALNCSAAEAPPTQKQ
jgi:hypothetical protein